jgi:hypothetical protein
MISPGITTDASTLLLANTFGSSIFFDGQIEDIGVENGKA